MTTAIPTDRTFVRWATLRWLMRTSLALGVTGLAAAVLIGAEDLAYRDDTWDGIGLAIATLLSLPALGVTVLSVIGLRQGGRRARSAQGTAAALGVLLLLPWVYAASQPVTWPLAALGLALVLASVPRWGRRGSRTRPGASGAARVADPDEAASRAGAIDSAV